MTQQAAQSSNPVETVTISSPDKGLSMVFYPAVGGSIGRFDLHKDGKTVPLFRPYDENADLHEFNMANFPMAPMCGRTDHGKLNANGKTYRVGPPSEGEPHPNHGNARAQAWRVSEQDENHIRMDLSSAATEEMPYDYEVYQSFTLKDNKVEVEMGITNRGSEPMPFGLGQHFYFARTPQTTIQFKADKVWRSEGMIPQDKQDIPGIWDFSEPKIIDPKEQEEKYGSNGTAYMDHCFYGFGGELVVTQPEHGVTVTYKGDSKHFIAYIPSKPDDFICAFAPSNMPNGFNRAANGEQDTGTIILQPGESMVQTRTLEIS